MRRSTERILTTHVGSLPRPAWLVDLITAGRRGAVDRDARSVRVREAVREVVGKQIEHRVDVVNDGEMGKESYATYVRERLTGFDGDGERSIGHFDVDDFPGYAEKLRQKRGHDAGAVLAPPACVGPIAVRDPQQVRTDIADLRAATAGAEVADVFVSAASPGVIALFFANRHYPTREDYLLAIAEAMRDEYEAIAAAGFVLQLDCPDLAMGRHVHVDLEGADLSEFRRHARLNVEALDHATANIGRDQMRMHLCWGNYEGPHHRDVDLASIIDIVLSARPNGLALEGANPRHEHEWTVFEDTRLPAGKLLIPGVIDSTSNYVEHPELVAQRLVRYARLVGRENVIAGTDCGFGTIAGNAFVDPDVMWAKFDAMAEGARIADRALARG